METLNVEASGIYKGYQWMCITQPLGHRCGYVRIPTTHYLYRKNYHQKLQKPSWNTIKHNSVGKISPISIVLAKKGRVTMDILFNVHGGITFSGSFKRFDIDGWWIGFDCSHVGDKKDPSIMDPFYRERIKKHSILLEGFPGDVIRTKEYVEEECKSLIRQLKKYYP